MTPLDKLINDMRIIEDALEKENELPEEIMSPKDVLGWENELPYDPEEDK